MEDPELGQTAPQRDDTGSAAAYRKTLVNVRKVKETFSITVPSGFVWEVRRPDLQGYIVTGRMPQALVEQFLAAAEAKGISPAEIKPIDPNKLQLTKQQTLASLEFMREVVRDACVKPRIVKGATGDDEIEPKEIDPDDFRYIFDWALSYQGVAAVQGLRTFRGKRKRSNAGVRSRSKKFQRAPLKATLSER